MTQGFDPSFASLLQSIQQNMRSRGPSNTDLAKYVLANSNIKFNTPMPVSVNPNHPSLLNRIVDVLSRPNYAVANMFHAAAKQENPLSALVRGLEGKDKTTFSDVIKNDLGIENKVVQGVGGFVGDVALDPTTYIGAGAIKDVLQAAGKKVGVVNKLAKSAGELPIKPAITEAAIIDSPEAIQKAAQVTDLGKFSASVAKGQDIAPHLASEADRTLVRQASEVVPSVEPKAKPPVNLSDLEKFDVQKAVANIPSTRSKINVKYPDTVNPNQQLRIYKKIQGLVQEAGLRSNSPAAFTKSMEMLQHAEATLEASGKTLRYWDGSNLKLSDVLAELGHAKTGKVDKALIDSTMRDLSKTGNIRYTNPDVAQSIHNVRVRSSLMDSEPVRKAIDAVIQEKQAIGDLPASDAHLSQLTKALPALAQRHAIEQGGSAAGADAATTLAKDTVRSIDAAKPQEAISRTSKYIEHQLETGDTNLGPRINQPLTNALMDDFGITTLDYHMPLNGKGGVESTFMGRIFSWYGQKDLRPLTEQQLLTATNAAWLRTAALKKISEKYTREQQLRAIRFSQGLEQDGGDLGLQFKAALENLFKGTGLTDKAWVGQSVVERSGLLMERLNKHLAQGKLPYRFISGKVTHPITGEVKDYSKGTDWLSSWQSWDIKEPQEFFGKLFSAVEQAAHEKSLLDEISSRFGSVVAGNGYRIKLDHPYLKGYYFTDDIAKQIPRVIHDMDTFFTTGANNEFLKTFDKISRAWKFTVTLPNPSHHIHNLLGDAYMSWMAGVRGVRPYQYAAQILRTQRNIYTDLNDLEKLVSVDAIPRAMGKTPDPKDVLFSNASGHPFTAEQLYVAANKMGILPQAHIVEDIIGGNTNLTRFQPFGGHVRAKLEHVSETREHFARIAHFVDVVRRSRGTDFEAIFRKAGYEVRKWHPDYLTLTPFEKKFMRRLMPFYSWTRRAIPLMIESAVMSPGKTLAYPKFMQAMQTMGGVEGADRGNPFPGNQLFPQWLRDRGIGPVFKGPELGARNNPPGQTIVNPSNPLYDLFGQFSNPLSGVGSMLTPAIRIPVELLSGKQLYNNAPIDKGNFSEYVGNQLPYWPLAQSLTGVTPTGGQTARAQKGEGFNKERFINWLTSIGVRGTGPYIKEAQFEQKRGG